MNYMKPYMVLWEMLHETVLNDMNERRSCEFYFIIRMIYAV
jgi:hypothetical protein